MAVSLIPIRVRYRIAYALRWLALKIEPSPTLLDQHLADLIRNIEPQSTPFLDTSKIVWSDAECSPHERLTPHGGSGPPPGGPLA